MDVEHIPEHDIGPVLDECRRILRPGGVASFLIDYSDHYSHFDPAITPYNFRALFGAPLELYNSLFQFQNRLRHSQYLAMFRRAGFDIVEQSATVSDTALAALRSVPLAGAFAGFDPADLAATGAHAVLGKAG